jgi:hypothetical protein
MSVHLERNRRVRCWWQVGSAFVALRHRAPGLDFAAAFIQLPYDSRPVLNTGAWNCGFSYLPTKLRPDTSVPALPECHFHVFAPALAIASSRSCPSPASVRRTSQLFTLPLQRHRRDTPLSITPRIAACLLRETRGEHVGAICCEEAEQRAPEGLPNTLEFKEGHF